MGKKKDPAVIRAINEVLSKYKPEHQAMFADMFYQTIKNAAEIAAQQAAEQTAVVVEKEHREYRSKVFNKYFANTKLLLRHYRSLNTYCENAVWEDDIDEYDEFMQIMDLMGQYNTKAAMVDAIKKSAEKTTIIMRHVKKMLAVYHRQCEKSKYPEDLRHWRVINGMYLLPDKFSADDIAKAENIDRRTVYKDVDAAVEDLTMLIFGIDGIEKLYK